LHAKDNSLLLCNGEKKGMTWYKTFKRGEKGGGKSWRFQYLISKSGKKKSDDYSLKQYGEGGERPNGGLSQSFRKGRKGRVSGRRGIGYRRKFSD